MSVENTSNLDPLSHLVGMLSGGQSDYIENMERSGSDQLAASDVFPVKAFHGSDDDLVAMGFVLGDPLESDPLFRPATFPTGWSRQRTDHSMWTDVVDGSGQVRVSMFYKAAFYDRKAGYSVRDLAAIDGGRKP